MLFFFFTSLLLCCVFWASRSSCRSRKSVPLPPGPKALPFIGNLHQIPKIDPFKTYRDWSSIYGPILYMHVFGREFVILNSLKIALDLFEKRSGIYSTRPRLVMAGELVGREKTTILFIKYGSHLKECRRLVHSWINQHTMRDYGHMQEATTHKLLAALVDDPERFSQHIRSTAGSLILKLTYGIDTLPNDDPHIAMSEELSKITAKATQPGKWLCDSFPFLSYVPAWFPGAGFQRWAKQARQISTQLPRIPFEMVKQAVIDGSATKSWMADGIFDENGQIKSGDGADALIVAAASLYAGAIDTIVSATRTFFLMMARNPEIQQKAQAEIDAVVGTHRLPSLNDRDSLPYINCLMKEVLRINPIVPLIPHSLDRDDVYEGYLIPKGAWVMVNLWAILNDPLTYRDPEEFRPERFEASLGSLAEPDPTDACFGFGRRFCPGFHYAQTSLFLNITHVLSAFDIGPAKTADGEIEIPPLEFDAGHLRAPRAFRCSIVPRNEEKMKLIGLAIAADQP